MRSARSQTERGVTLVEMVIAITIVAAIAGGLLTTMRTSLDSFQKVQGHLEANRRTMVVQQAIERQISSVMPVIATCGGPRVAMFSGNPDSLQLVSTYSITEGFRGYPRLVQFQVVPEPGGTFRLLLNERIYQGPQSLAQLCGPFVQTPQTLVLAERLAYARFFFHERIPGALDRGEWVSTWDRVPLPSAVRLEMASADANPARLPMMSLHIPIRLTLDVGAPYVDQ